MRKWVFWLLLALSAIPEAACAPSSDPARAEPPIQPLIIGKSPPMPIATSNEPTAPDDDPRATGAPTTALAVPARDPRLARGRQRARALIVTELQALENLFAATPSTSPDRPALVRRLAEDYAELSRSTDGPTSTSAHHGALRYYEMLVNEYPRSPQVDEAWYYAGLEYELAGNLPKARRAYFELIRTSPQSKLIPLAYFAFGEMFNAEAVSDPSKNDLAIAAYTEVLKYPPSGNPVYDDAQRRMGEVNARKAAASSGGSPLTRP